MYQDTQHNIPTYLSIFQVKVFTRIRGTHAFHIVNKHKKVQGSYGKNLIYF